MGGSLGTAALGAVFTARLTAELVGTPAAQVSGGGANPAAIQRLPAAVRDAYTARSATRSRPYSSSPP